MHAAVANAFAAIPQTLRLLQVKRQLVMRAGWAVGLRACQFSRLWWGEEGGPIEGGCHGDGRRQDVVVGVDRRQARRNREVRLLLL